MPQIINTNIPSLTAQRNLNTSQSSLATSLQRLSSGLRINSAKDDAAGLAISERFTTQIRGLNQAIRNANDGVSFSQTAEGALSTTGDALQRIRELAVQSINDTNSSSDRTSLNNEVQQLIAEVNRIASATQFNGQNILDGSLANLTFQVGANQNQTIQVDGVDARGSQLGAATATGIAVATTNTSAGQDSFQEVVTDGLDLTINGTNITLSAATINDADGNADVDLLVNEINAVANDTGVTAQKASSLSQVLAYTADTDDARTLTINGVAIAIGAGATSQDVADAVNSVSGQTGVEVTAVATPGGDGDITFANVAGGADLTIAQDADPDDGGTDNENIFAALVVEGGAAGDAGAVTFQAGVILATDVGDDPTITGGTNVVTALGLTGLSGNFTDTVLNNVDVLTGSNANDALQTLDFALNQVNSLRAELGAVQIRFESTITNLSVTSENLSAARSRIRDADFAAETANLTRSQILQQAGISVLSQANAQPQNVLALLQ